VRWFADDFTLAQEIKTLYERKDNLEFSPSTVGWKYQLSKKSSDQQVKVLKLVGPSVFILNNHQRIRFRRTGSLEEPLVDIYRIMAITRRFPGFLSSLK